jgi:hypothetical protein
MEKILREFIKNAVKAMALIMDNQYINPKDKVSPKVCCGI